LGLVIIALASIIAALVGAPTPGGGAPTSPGGPGGHQPPILPY